jgi:hypothetical protein
MSAFLGDSKPTKQILLQLDPQKHRILQSFSYPGPLRLRYYRDTPPGIIDLGFTFAKAGNRRQFTLNSQLDYTGDRNRAKFSYDAMLSSTNDEQDVNRALFMLTGGMSYTKEDYVDAGDNDNAEGVFGFEAQYFKLYTPKVDLVTTFFVLPNFTTSGRVRIELDSKIRLEVISDLYVSFSFYDSYDSQSPS